MGRATPNQKLDFVRILQEHGEKVAMTGDGINDVLALKNSD
ncbi:HAD family hydrolase, partial [Erysipelothrix rhusiopathiae]|nr:HAD family hydrolase [Erysipelothrix rhusiopathiae]